MVLVATMMVLLLEAVVRSWLRVFVVVINYLFDYNY